MHQLQRSSAQINTFPLYFLAVSAPLRDIYITRLFWQKKDGPEWISPLGAVKPGDVLLSHNL